MFHQSRGNKWIYEWIAVARRRNQTKQQQQTRQGVCRQGICVPFETLSYALLVLSAQVTPSLQIWPIELLTSRRRSHPGILSHHLTQGEEIWQCLGHLGKKKQQRAARKGRIFRLPLSFFSNLRAQLDPTSQLPSPLGWGTRDAWGWQRTRQAREDPRTPSGSRACGVCQIVSAHL